MSEFLLVAAAIIGILYFSNQGSVAFLRGGTAAGGPGPGPGGYPLGAATPAMGLQSGASTQGVTGANLGGTLIAGGASVGTGAAAASGSFTALGLSGAAAGAAVAGIGVVAAIGAALWMAHEKRKAQAIDENSAVNNGVAQWDIDVRNINAAYNSRQIDANSAINLMGQAWAAFWQLVTPHIQPGRNGCNGGASCPPYAGCKGSIGAACCVGCYDLAGSTQTYVFSSSQGGDGVTAFYFGYQGTVAVLQHGGGVVLYQGVVSSGYGTNTRAPYRLTWSQVAAA